MGKNQTLSDLNRKARRRTEQLETEKNKVEEDRAALVATQKELQHEKATTIVLAAQNEQLKNNVARQKSENDQLKSEVLNRKEDNVTLLNLAWQAKYALEDERAARKAGKVERNIPAHSVLERNIPAYSVLVHAKLKKLLLLRNCLRDLIILLHSRWSRRSYYRLLLPSGHAQAFLAFKLCELVALVLLRFCLLFDLILLCLLAPS